MKAQRSSELVSRWIIVEEEIIPKNLAENSDEIPVSDTEEFSSLSDIEDPSSRSNTQICAHFDDHDMAVCSLKSLMEVESQAADKSRFKVRTDSGFISVDEETERVCYIATLH